ncbi:hypothetical protein AN958_08673 [Leucoagaricus sp. SymC.cos]|nr:hypothetical protein AN958_08673 [Leucoagaricus sp. SymC.cos]
MLTHRGFSAWIVVDGKTLPEHLVSVDDSANKVSCWIPSEEGKAFTVYWQDHGGKVETCGYIMLDGYLAPGRFLYGEGTTWRGGVRTGPASERPFIFQKVEENDLKNVPTTEKDVGTIVLQIKRVKFSASASPNTIQQLPQAHKGRNGMRIGFGAEQPTFEQYPSTWKVESYDNPGQMKPNTYVSFIFRYRNPDFLCAQGIIEDTTPSVAPIQNLPQRRVASMPVPTPPITFTPSPSPPFDPKKPLFDSVYYRLGSQQLKRPTTDSRRAVSLQASIEVEDDKEKPVNYPGEGLIIFPFHKPRRNDSDPGTYNFASASKKRL